MMVMFTRCWISCLAWICIGGIALAEDNPTPAEPESSSGERGSSSGEPTLERIGIIDMAYVFKNSDRFTHERDALKADITKSDVTAKLMVKELKEVEQARQQAAKGTQEFTDLEADLARKKVDFEIFRKEEQAKYVKREAQIYKDVYLDVQKAVADHAERHGFTLVVRFNRESVHEKKKPEDIIQAVGKQIVYFRPQHDITDEVLKQLNDDYREKSASKQKPKTDNP